MSSFVADKIVMDGLTFDDVLLIPQASDVLPAQVDLRTNLTSEICLNLPIVSAAMDTVTEDRLAIAMAREGGMGIIQKNMSIEDQAKAVDKVKRSEHGVITDPFFLEPQKPKREVQNPHYEEYLQKLPHKNQPFLLVIPAGIEPAFPP